MESYFFYILQLFIIKNCLINGDALLAMMINFLHYEMGQLTIYFLTICDSFIVLELILLQLCYEIFRQ